MIVILNEKRYEVEPETTLASFVENMNIRLQGVAIAIDYEVVPKSEWKSIKLKDGMELMMIQAVSGG